MGCEIGDREVREIHIRVAQRGLVDALFQVGSGPFRCLMVGSRRWCRRLLL